jgi:hypothetical protein
MAAVKVDFKAKDNTRKKKKDYFETSERIKLPREDTNFKHVWTEQKNFKIHDAKTNCKEKLINP